MSEKLTTHQVAIAVGLSDIRIRQMISTGIIQAEKFGRDYMIDAKYIEVINNRPERRGRKQKKAA